MTQREKDDELHRARVHMQFVCRMYKLQHDEGRHFLHEHCHSELPWRKDCVEETQEMTGAKLMSVSRGKCNLSSSEKPTMIATNCPAIAFTLRVSAKARLLNKRFSEHLWRNEHSSVEGLHEDMSCGIQLQHKWNGQHKCFLPVWTQRIRSRELRRSRKTAFLLKNRTMSCPIKHGMITLESLWTR